ncbi:hypothetical protein JNJ66_01335 [Candidatus Saccharibacteria bacterium]|nr:hypothetical protein [Candidatus Saccharibacteria bacterium]
MLGIPSRAEAVEQYPDYAEAVRRDDLALQLLGLRQIFLRVSAHNHVAEAYRDAGLIERFMAAGEITRINPKRVPKRVAERLNPRWVLERYVAAIGRYRTVLQQARDLLDVPTVTVIQTTAHLPLGGLYDCVAVEEVVTDQVIGAAGISVEPGRGRGWQYSFNLYELAMRLLDEFEQQLGLQLERALTPFEQIVAMVRVATGMEEEGNFQLVDGRLPALYSARSGSMEIAEGHPVQQLFLRHAALTAESDIALRFDDQYFALGRGAGRGMVPSGCLLTDEQRFHHQQLGHRMALRRQVVQAVAESGQAVIHGVAYRPEAIVMEDGVTSGYAADGTVHQEIVNLLGVPVRQQDGTVVLPDAWAEEEVELVTAYLDGDEEAVEVLLSVYDLDASSGHSSRGKRLAQLAYVTRPRD